MINERLAVDWCRMPYCAKFRGLPMSTNDWTSRWLCMFAVRPKANPSLKWMIRHLWVYLCYIFIISFIIAQVLASLWRRTIERKIGSLPLFYWIGWTERKGRISSTFLKGLLPGRVFVNNLSVGRPIRTDWSRGSLNNSKTSALKHTCRNNVTSLKYIFVALMNW